MRAEVIDFEERVEILTEPLKSYIQGCVRNEPCHSRNRVGKITKGKPWLDRLPSCFEVWHLRPGGGHHTALQEAPLLSNSLNSTKVQLKCKYTIINSYKNSTILHISLNWAFGWFTSLSNPADHFIIQHCKPLYVTNCNVELFTRGAVSQHGVAQHSGSCDRTCSPVKWKAGHLAGVGSLIINAS